MNYDLSIVNYLSTICAISTAPGLGGIAVIRVSGKDAIAISDTIVGLFKIVLRIINNAHNIL